MCLMCLAKSIEEIYVYLLKQSMPRQGTETIFLDIFIPVLRETINTPLGDGNSQGISFRHCTMKKITAPPGDEAKKD